MIEHVFDPERGILHLRPTGPLQQGDFKQLAKMVNSLMNEKGDLDGLILEVQRFPGWNSFGAMIAHFQFIREYHRRIKKIALVTDSLLPRLARHIASHFLSAKIKHFKPGEVEKAKGWILGTRQY